MAAPAATATGARVFNFSAGPCTLPLEVMERARDEFVEFRDEKRSHGMSLLEMSHRSEPVMAVRDAAASLVRELLDVPSTHRVVFLGGGATLQFGMVPMNLLAPGRSAAYADCGAWSAKAIKDAERVGAVERVWDGSAHDYMTLPDPADLASATPADAAYLHLCSNETIQGLQMQAYPEVAPPVVCDMSSDFLSRPVAVRDFGLIYAGAQKNIGPAGVAVVIVRDDVLEACRGDTVGYLGYAGHVKGDSMLNTPPVFQIRMIQLVLEWLRDRGGVEWAAGQAEQRSRILYDAIVRSGGFYRCPVDPGFRSKMNVVFRLPDADLEQSFVSQADEAGFSGLKGHRSVGGCRASIYNAMPVAGAEALAEFMDDFADRHG